MDIFSISSRWRQENGYQGRGGVVVLFDGDVQGWCDMLRDPGHWLPGCIAVDESGQHWEAVGDNCINGATDWRKLEEKSDL